MLLAYVISCFFCRKRRSYFSPQILFSHFLLPEPTVSPTCSYSCHLYFPRVFIFSLVSPSYLRAPRQMYPCIPLITKIAGLDSHVPPACIPLSRFPGAMDQLCHPRKLPTPLPKSTVTKLYWFCLSVLSAVCFWTKRQVSTFRALSLHPYGGGGGRPSRTRFSSSANLQLRVTQDPPSSADGQMAPLSLFTQYSPSPGVPRLLGEHG